MASRGSRGAAATRTTVGRSALAGAAMLLTACASGTLFGDDEPLVTTERNLTDGPLEAAGLTGYLEMMRSLVEGDPARQAETFGEVARAVDEAPTTTNRLKLALALATPGHAATDTAAAQRQLNDLLMAGAALLPEERMLVAIHLEEVEERLSLAQQAEQVREQTVAAAAQRDGELTQQLDSARAENQMLRRQLEEAEQKLNAITNIERQIRERENDSDTQ